MRAKEVRRRASVSPSNLDPGEEEQQPGLAGLSVWDVVQLLCLYGKSPGK